MKEIQNKILRREDLATRPLFLEISARSVVLESYKKQNKWLTAKTRFGYT